MQTPDRLGGRPDGRSHVRPVYPVLLRAPESFPMGPEGAPMRNLRAPVQGPMRPMRPPPRGGNPNRLSPRIENPRGRREQAPSMQRRLSDRRTSPLSRPLRPVIPNRAKLRREPPSPNQILRPSLLVELSETFGRSHLLTIRNRGIVDTPPPLIRLDPRRRQDISVLVGKIRHPRLKLAATVDKFSGSALFHSPDRSKPLHS